jgi:hypothetical protein
MAKKGSGRGAAARVSKQQELTGARALVLLKPNLAAIGRDALASRRVDIGAAAIVAQGVSKRTLAPAMRGRFEKMASIGEFELRDLELLALAALATQEARQNADKALAKGAGAVPLPLLKEAANVEHRMQAACEHTLAGIDAATAELARLSPGTGYRDLADDLMGYADLYDAHPDAVAKDGVNYVAADAADARRLARKIYDTLGAELTERDKAQLDTLARAWTFLVQVYERVAVIGRFLERADPGTSFPSLFTSTRGRGGRPRKAAQPAASPAAWPSPAEASSPAEAATARPAPGRGGRRRR